jgi:hypothetical protein
MLVERVPYHPRCQDVDPHPLRQATKKVHMTDNQRSLRAEQYRVYRPCLTLEAKNIMNILPHFLLYTSCKVGICPLCSSRRGLWIARNITETRQLALDSLQMPLQISLPLFPLDITEHVLKRFRSD